MTPLVGIPACRKQFERMEQFATHGIYARAVQAAAGCVPVLLPPLGRAMLDVLDRLDGLLLSGSESNVGPDLYGAADETPEQHDPDRDSTTLPLIREAVRRGMPLLAICRGIQEVNVALGGTLHQRVHTLTGRMDHREPDGTVDARFALVHDVAVTGGLAAMLGTERVRVNSLHGQAVDRPAPGLAIEALAEDGTIEALRGATCPGFVLGVQWHPEWHAATDAPSRAIFQAFGEACRAYARAAQTPSPNPLPEGEGSFTSPSPSGRGLG